MDDGIAFADVLDYCRRNKFRELHIERREDVWLVKMEFGPLFAEGDASCLRFLFPDLRTPERSDGVSDE